MSDDLERYRTILSETRDEAKRRRIENRKLEAKIAELEKAVSERDQRIGEFEKQISEYETALVELDDHRLELESQVQNIPQELEDYRREAFLSEHRDAFQQMLGDSGLHPQANIEQLWQMVGYDPDQIEELTPELVNEVLSVAKQQAPFLFMGKDVSQPMPPRGQQYQTGPQSAGLASQQGFVQPSGFMSSPAVAQQASRQAPAAPQGWSSVGARGVPISPPTQAIQGRFQDPKWIAANQKAIAEAVESGAQFINSD